MDYCQGWGDGNFFGTPYEPLCLSITFFFSGYFISSILMIVNYAYIHTLPLEFFYFEQVPITRDLLETIHKLCNTTLKILRPLLTLRFASMLNFGDKGYPIKLTERFNNFFCIEKWFNLIIWFTIWFFRLDNQLNYRHVNSFQ